MKGATKEWMALFGDEKKLELELEARRRAVYTADAVPLRNQGETALEREELSASVIVQCTKKEDRTDQTAKETSDINFILQRFRDAGEMPLVRPVVYGDQDFASDGGMQAVLAAVKEAKDAYAEMPEMLRLKYPTYTEFVKALELGQLEFSLDQPAEGAAGGSAAASGGSPSESAAGGSPAA